ncbi:MAG: hypothetical protein WA771_03625 [Chthoniobacterales bacterium]
MKIAPILCVLSALTFLVGCAFTETTTDDVGDQFQEGIQGRGRIVENDPTSDNLGPIYR